MITIIIRLVDGEGDTLQNEGLGLDPETSFHDLKNLIETVTHIPRLFQDVKFGGEIILSSQYPLRSKFEGGEELVVKHASLPQWDGLLTLCKSFHETYAIDYKKFCYDLGQQLIEVLDKTKFFVAYPKYIEKRNEIDKMLFTYYDRSRGAIQNSAKKFFKELYGEKAEIRFESRSVGSRRGCICFVETEGTTVKYHIKTHHGGGDRESRSLADLDPEELFVYKLLQNLGVGAEIEFIPNEVGSRWLLYIAGRDIDGFRTIKEIESTEEGDLSNYKRTVIQMRFLYEVLNMADYHWSNMGVDRSGSPLIVDFYMIERDSIDVKEHFYFKVRGAERINKILGTFEEKLEIGKEYLKDSDFVSKVDETLESFLRENKKLFAEGQQYFRNKDPTNDLMRFVEKIKENASKFDKFQF